MPEFSKPHWTDEITDGPIFDTAIPARGPDGNIFAIMGQARRLLKQAGIPEDRIKAAMDAVIETGSYDDACAVIERWFRVDR